MKYILSLNRAVFFPAALVTFLLFQALILMPQVSLAAAVETVTNTDNMGAGSLRDTIANVDLGGTVNFNIPGPAPHTIILTSQININKSMTINGPGPDMLTISGNNSNRIFVIGGADDTTVLISGLKLINANIVNNGGAIRNTRQLSIDSCVFENNRAVNGGAIFNNTGRTISSITKSTFRGNTATGGDGGGAILNDIESTIEEITNCTFSENSAQDGLGGAIFNHINGTVNISFSTITENTAPEGEGSLLVPGHSIYETL